MNQRPSWRLKLDRAEEHLTDLTEMLKPFGELQEYSVTEHVEQDHGLVYRLWATGKPDPRMAVVLGDFLFNVRSGLDHVAVSLVSGGRQEDASFPIFTIDPEKAHPDDIEGDKRRRARWRKATGGMSPEVLAVMRSVQPFDISRAPHLDYVTLKPTDSVLEVLRTFQNADKHRKLVTHVGGLMPVHVTGTLPTGRLSTSMSFGPLTTFRKTAHA